MTYTIHHCICTTYNVDHEIKYCMKKMYSKND